MSSEKACLLCILKVRGLGPQSLAQLKSKIGSYREIWKAPYAQVERIIGSSLAQGLMEVRCTCDPEEELGKCIGLGIQVMAEYEDEYPGPCGRYATRLHCCSTVGI